MTNKEQTDAPTVDPLWSEADNRLDEYEIVTAIVANRGAAGDHNNEICVPNRRWAELVRVLDARGVSYDTPHVDIMCLTYGDKVYTLEPVWENTPPVTKETDTSDAVKSTEAIVPPAAVDRVIAWCDARRGWRSNIWLNPSQPMPFLRWDTAPREAGKRRFGQGAPATDTGERQAGRLAKIVTRAEQADLETVREAVADTPEPAADLEPVAAPAYCTYPGHYFGRLAQVAIPGGRIIEHVEITDAQGLRDFCLAQKRYNAPFTVREAVDSGLLDISVVAAWSYGDYQRCLEKALPEPPAWLLDEAAD